MKRRRYTDEQIVRYLRGAERSGTSIVEYCRANGLNETTFYKWRKRFGTMEVNEVREYRSLQEENGRLKKLLAERDLEIDAMKDVLSKKW